MILVDDNLNGNCKILLSIDKLRSRVLWKPDRALKKQDFNIFNLLFSYRMPVFNVSHVLAKDYKSTI